MEIKNRFLFFNTKSNSLQFLLKMGTVFVFFHTKSIALKVMYEPTQLSIFKTKKMGKKVDFKFKQKYKFNFYSQNGCTQYTKKHDLQNKLLSNRAMIYLLHTYKEISMCQLKQLFNLNFSPPVDPCNLLILHLATANAHPRRPRM